MKEFDSGLVDDSLSFADVVRNATNEHGRSVQSKSYDVMYCATKSNRNEGRKVVFLPCDATRCTV